MAVVLFVAACSSGGDAAPDTTLPPVTTTFDSSVPAVTDATPATTTNLAVESSPSTTVDPARATEEEVRAAVEQAIADFTECLLALPECDPDTLAATRADPILAINQSRINEWNEAGYSVVDRDQFRYVIESVELDDDLHRGTVIVCIADGSKLVHRGAGPDGADIIIDDVFVSGRDAWDMQLGDDGIWRVHDAPTVGPTESSDICPPA